MLIITLGIIFKLFENCKSEQLGQVTGSNWDTHFIIDTDSAQRVVFSDIRQTELTDERTQEGVDITR
jgi:hypothetical protein